MLSEELKRRLKGKVVILGIGNTLKGDDGFGPELIKQLKGRVTAELIDGGVAPENYLKPIVDLRPDTIMILDAVHFGGSPGDIRILEPKDLLSAGISTHNLSPKMLIDFLGRDHSADIFVLAIQPESIEFGKKMSQEVRRAEEEIEELLVKILRER